jgi:hypothetical protein
MGLIDVNFNINLQRLKNTNFGWQVSNENRNVKFIKIDVKINVVKSIRKLDVKINVSSFFFDDFKPKS